MTTTTQPEFVITRDFDAPRNFIFRLWLDPKHLARWWGPRQFTASDCETDPRPGGAYRITMRSPDGVEYPLKGVYQEIVEPERIVMTLDCSGHPEAWHDMVKPNRSKEEKNPAGNKVGTITFEDLGGRTRITVRITFESTAIRDAMLKMGMNEGWSETLERLGELAKTADREIVISRTLTAPRELVWDAMTKPDQVVKWWGPRGFTTTIQEMDVRVGGAWKLMMHGPDGTDYPNKSIFTEVTKPERLRFSHGGGTKGKPGATFDATWTFEALGPDTTRVTIHMVFPTAEERDTVVQVYGAIEGGKQTLARLEEVLTGKAV